MLGKKLKRFFDRPDLSGYRFVPRAYSSRGPGWGVYDRREERFLSDAEVKQLPSDRLMNEPRVAN